MEVTHSERSSTGLALTRRIDVREFVNDKLVSTGGSGGGDRWIRDGGALALAIRSSMTGHPEMEVASLVIAVRDDVVAVTLPIWSPLEDGPVLERAEPDGGLVAFVARRIEHFVGPATALGSGGVAVGTLDL